MLKSYRTSETRTLFFFCFFFSFQQRSGGSPLTLRPNFKSEKGSVTAAAAACMPRRGIFVGGNLLYNLRVMLKSYRTSETRTLFFFCFFFSFQQRSGGSPLTLRPNFKSEKGSVTAAAAACMPRRGIFVGGNLLYNLRVMLKSYRTSETRTLFFFCFFFLFSKEKKKRNSL
ncbi:MAG: hypothetical protein ACLS4X_08785 [Ruminococcus callidus]